jgi:hypothetical protein
MNSNPTTLSVDEQIEATAEFLSSPLISQSGRNSIIKALIRKVCEEVIGEDASMGRDALTYDEKEHINQWLNEQRTKLNKIMGDKK